MSLGPISAILETGIALANKFIPDPAQKADAIFRLEELHAKGDSEKLQAEVQLILGQIEINKIEAAHPSMFVAGWRPFAGWICGLALAYATILEPFMRFFAKVGFGYGGDFPVIDTNLTMQILIGMLGLGALKSTDMKSGVATTQLVRGIK